MIEVVLHLDCGMPNASMFDGKHGVKTHLQNWKVVLM